MRRDNEKVRGRRAQLARVAVVLLVPQKLPEELGSYWFYTTQQASHPRENIQLHRVTMNKCAQGSLCILKAAKLHSAKFSSCCIGIGVMELPWV